MKTVKNSKIQYFLKKKIRILQKSKKYEIQQ